MTTLLPVPDRQPSLFGALPTTEPRRRRRTPRPAATPAPPIPTDQATAVGVGVGAITNPAIAEPVIIATAMAPTVGLPVRVDAAALTNPELNDLVQALATPGLAFLLTATAREVRRRLAPDDADAGTDGEAEPIGFAPPPALVRAARTAVSELAEEE